MGFAERIRLQDILNEKGVPRPKTKLLTYNGYLYGLDNAVCGQEVKFHLVCDCKHKFSYRTKDRCPKCNVLISKMKHPIYRSYAYYYNLRRKKQGLPCRVISEKKIDTFLMRYGQENLTFRTDLMKWSRDIIANICKEEKNKVKRKQQAVAQSQQDLQEQRKRIRSGYITGILSAEDSRKALREIEQKVKTFTGRSGPNMSLELDEIILLTEKFVGIFQNGSQKEKRDVLSKMRLNLHWNEEKLSIINESWLQILIDGLKEINVEIQTLEPPKSVGNKGWEEVKRVLFPSLCRMWDNVRNNYPTRKVDTNSGFDSQLDT